jgi:peptidase M28-like protein
MRLADLVATLYRAFDPDLAMADVRAICEHDRYQASAGITAAAGYVAERASAAGLTDVTVFSFPADGAKRWWTYRAPRSWTPVRASLAVDGALLVSYPAQAYTLAAYSAPTPPGGRTLPLVRYSAARAGRAARGALVVLDEPVALGDIAGSMAAAGAVAFAVDALSGRPDRTAGQVGRLELAPGSKLAAFSVTAAQLSSLLTAADAGATATADIELDAAVSAMPVVTGWLPGTSQSSRTGELLLSAHLCHPRPGANDNASGVAALLGIARMLAGSWQGGGVRFLWGPEFVGTVAYLHDLVGSGKVAPPSLAINIDLAGQDVARCGGPLVIERGPDDIGSFLPALTARCAALLPAASRSYSGAVPCEPWTWRATPFAGGSDHALLADQPVRCQVVGLGHWPDRANHSSADTPELVDPAELRRTAVIAAATVAACGGGDAELTSDVAQATVSWAADHVLAVLPGHRAAPPGLTGSPVLDPHDEVNAVRWLRHRGGVGCAAVGAVAAVGVDQDWVRAAQDWVGALVQATADRLAAAANSPSQGGPAGSANEPALVRCWSGPANVRALAEDATAADRDWLAARLAADRGGNYARVLALLSGVNGERNRDEVAWWAALSSELPISLSFAETFLGLASRAGWVRMSQGDQS